MGTHRSGNGGSGPPDGDRPRDEVPGELPELPPEWGDIVIPDDPAALAAEAELVRQELAQEAADRAWGRPPPGRGATAEPSLGVPLLVMSIAVLITLVSLFAMTWAAPAERYHAPPRPAALPVITLQDAAGHPVTPAAMTPLVLMLVEDCECGPLVAATVQAAPTGVAVIAVGRDAPAVPPGIDPADPTLHLLADPDGLLRSAMDLGEPNAAATVLLVNPGGEIVDTVLSTYTLATYQAALAGLAG